MATEGVFQTFQKIATIVHRVDSVTEDLKDFRASITVRVEKLESQTGDLRERVARLEASREADQAQMRAELARFKTEVERAELRWAMQLPSSTKPPESSN